jgi:hypothetical protein
MLTEEQVKGLEAWVAGFESGKQHWDVLASMQQLIADHGLLRSSAVVRALRQEDLAQEDDAELAAMAYALAEPVAQRVPIAA